MNTWSTSIHSATQLLNVFLIISGRKQKIHLQCSAGLWCGAVVWCRMFLTCLAPECVRWPWDMVIIIILVNTHYCSLHLIFFTPECLQPFSHILDTHQSTCSHIFSSSPHLLLWQHQLVLLVMTGLFLWFDLNIKKGQLPSNLYDLSWNLMCWLQLWSSRAIVPRACRWVCSCSGGIHCSCLHWRGRGHWYWVSDPAHAGHCG